MMNSPGLQTGEMWQKEFEQLKEEIGKEYHVF